MLSEDELRRLRKGWEHRFPDLGGQWTHWWIEGDGGLLGVLPGHELVAALQLVADNCHRYESIYAQRAWIESDGQVYRQNARAEIANRRKEQSTTPTPDPETAA